MLHTECGFACWMVIVCASYIHVLFYSLFVCDENGCFLTTHKRVNKEDALVHASNRRKHRATGFCNNNKTQRQLKIMHWKEPLSIIRNGSMCIYLGRGNMYVRYIYIITIWRIRVMMRREDGYHRWVL